MSSIDWSLAWRMLLSIAVLGALTLGLVAGVSLVCAVVVMLFTGDPFVALVGGTVVGVGLLAAIGYLEYRELGTVAERTGARPVSAEEFPHLHALVERVASQLGVPTPTIALTEDDVPEAMVVGVRPSETTLVLSYGTLGALDDDELETVVAHELAHVQNYDAAVMTVLSTPAVLAASFRAQLERNDESADEVGLDRIDDPDLIHPGAGEWREDDDDDEGESLGNEVVRLTLLGIVTATLIASRAVIALSSRARERTADRTAALATGQPADLASALRTLDAEIADAPARDLRSAASVSSLSVLPLDPAIAGDVGIDDEDGSGSGSEHASAATDRPLWQRFRTHPSTEDRIAELASIEQALQGSDSQ